MSGPYSAAFSGANTGIPGYSVGPTSQNLGAQAPNIPSLGWGSLNAGEAASWANFGVGSGVYHTATHPSNDFIQQQFVIHPWNDGAHLNIAEFQIVCCNRSVADHNFNMYTAVSLAKINELLSDAFATFDAVTAGQDRDAEAMLFLDLLNKYGEDKLEMYHKFQKLYGSAGARKILGNDPAGAVELEKFYNLATTKPVLRYMTKLGILLQWNVMGVTVGVNRGTGLDERELAATSERISVINTIMAKRATTHNIFGSNKELCTGADTYLVLRRVARRGVSGPGRFEFVPYATRERLGVPRHLAIYSDDSSAPNRETGRRMVNSHVIPFGVVTQPAGRDAPPGIREVACGLNGNNKVAFEAIATLPTIHVQRLVKRVAVMSYANPMNQRRREPIAAQGEITGKAFLDTMELADRRENAADAFLLATSYPGGENDHNFSVMPGEMVFGLRKRGSDFMSSGEPNEFGMTSMAGLNWGRYKSLDHCMRDYYFIGLAKTEFRVGNADQPEHGFATIRAGSYSTINNGARDIHAGDLVGYTFPITRREGYKNDRSQKLMPYNATENSMDRIVPQNRGGTPNTKYLPELTPFDYTDFTTSLSGALVGMPWPMAEGGSADCDYKDFWDVNELRNRPLTNMAEEQMGYKFGLVGAVLRGMEYIQANVQGNGTLAAQATAASTVAGIVNDIGIFKTALKHADAKDEHWYKMLCAIFGKNHSDTTIADEHRDVHVAAMNAPGIVPATKEVHRKYLQLTRTCMQTLCSGIASSWYHMSTRVIGRAMNRCRQTETAHIVLGHFRRL